MSMEPNSLGGILKRAYPTLDIKGDFADRIRLQKFIYLLREWGRIDLLYDFNLYLYGPYSPALANDAFHIENYDKLKEYTFNEKEIEDKFVQFLGEIENFKTPEELEIVTSAKYLHNASPRKKLDEIINEIKKKRNGALKEETIRKTLNQTRSIGHEF